MSYEFQSGLYRTQKDMPDAIAESWVTANGANSPATIADWIAQGDLGPRAAAREMAENWFSRAWMEERGITRTDLADAVRRYVKNFKIDPDGSDDE